MPPLHLATFACDVTPPLGHPLCGGWIEPVRGVDDPLEALGVVLLGAGKPVVLCAVDWCGLRNEAFRTWRATLADAAHTTPEHVSLHVVHPHNAPFADTGAERLIAAAGAPHSLDLAFFDDCVKRSADALRASLMKAKRFTHVGHGSGKVEQVASSRRVLGPDGTVKFTRYSATKDPAVRAEPEGLIDPHLRTLSLWDGDTPLAALHFYACHPMSYYGDGRVTADFCGLARRKRRADDPAVVQVYFNGAGGNVTAGKYNDGAKENRPVLRDRVYAGMVAAWKDTKRTPVSGWDWRSEAVKLPPRREAAFGAEASRKLLDDPKATAARRANAAFQLAWLKRADTPIEVNCLDFGAVAGLFLPGEAFVEYQLAAQKLRPDGAVCVAAYGDDGPGYIPTAKAFLEGGYEPTVALAGPDSEDILLKAIRRLLVPEKGAKK
ncbi:MAG: hypothetical protein K2X87_20720 [Gemmataceae bacterium]|nr:hypothetical protein [Gemmataceae bacterium]